MLDDRARRAVAPALNAVAARLDSLGVPPLALTIIGWLIGVGACVSAGLGAWTLALILWLANRVFDGLDGPLARRRGATELGGFLDIVADFSIYAGFVVGVAIAVPTARLAVLVLLSAYYVSGTAFLALSALLERRGASENDDRSLRFVGGLAEGTETVIVYVLFCSLPGHAELIAWIWSGAVAITAVQRVARGVTLLRQRRAITSPESIEQCARPDNEPSIEQQQRKELR